MNVARSLKEVEFNSNSIVTVGTFDGVHLGHKAILGEVMNDARMKKSRTVVVTFDPHPREVVGKGPVEYLSTLDERLSKFGEIGIQQVVVIEFTYEFSRLGPRDFYQLLATHVGLKEVIVGYDHMFGKDRTGGIEELESIGSDLGFGAKRVSPVVIGGTVVSSSTIRKQLREGDVSAALELIGGPYSLRGIVVAGDSRGKQLGFPTANVNPMQPGKLIPANGVYAVGVLYDSRKLYGMMNIGVRPTFKDNRVATMEVHIFDFNENIYKKDLEIRFLKFIRPEKKFSSKDELVSQLHHDRIDCLKYLGRSSHH